MVKDVNINLIFLIMVIINRNKENIFYYIYYKMVYKKSNRRNKRNFRSKNRSPKRKTLKRRNGIRNIHVVTRRSNKRRSNKRMRGGASSRPANRAATLSAVRRAGEVNRAFGAAAAAAAVPELTSKNVVGFLRNPTTHMATLSKLLETDDDEIRTAAMEYFQVGESLPEDTWDEIIELFRSVKQEDYPILRIDLLIKYVTDIKDRKASLAHIAENKETYKQIVGFYEIVKKNTNRHKKFPSKFTLKDGNFYEVIKLFDEEEDLFEGFDMSRDDF